MSVKIALAGNPNCGKTTLFNALTGSNQFVGNWPGVTVEKKEGKLKGNKDVTITDLPGIYSLSPYTLEEVVARNYLINEKPDAIINIIDGTNIERNLYLSTQIMELGIPVIMAVNMVDLLERNGITLNASKLSEKLGCEVVEISALKGTGIKEAAEKCGMYYVDQRWLGGMLTNFKTIKTRVQRLKDLEKMQEDGTFDVLPKKEVILLKKEMEKLQTNLGGIKDMEEMPGVIFLVDPKKEYNAINEAKKLNIPTVGIVDTNCNPEVLDYAIPGNDDAIRAVKLITDVMANAVIEGKQGESFEESQDVASEEAETMEEVVAEVEE